MQYILIELHYLNIESQNQDIQIVKRNITYPFFKTIKSVNFIKNMYGVPKSSLYNLKKLNEKRSNMEEVKVNIMNNNNCLNLEEKNWLKENINPPKPPITIDKLNKKMSFIFTEKNRKRDIKIFFKNEKKFSYKKGSSKVINWFTSKNEAFQSIFSSRCLFKILEGKYLINIDEASF